MTQLVEPLFVQRGRNKISSSPLLVDANGDGWPEVFVGGPVLRGLEWDGTPLPGWPRRGTRPFASSPAFGDLSGDHRGCIVIGCDDGRVYAFHVDGERQVGWPVSTGNDVFSTPALADLNHDRSEEAVLGSDDGCLYTVRGDGTVSSSVSIPKRPFVSASPTVLEGEAGASPQVVIGAWDGRLYVTGGPANSELLPLSSTDHVIWSSAASFQLKGVGACLAVGADRVYLITASGTALPGWPQRTGSWMASSPAVVELEAGAGPTVLIGSDRLYAWDLYGHSRPGWPQPSGDFVWASPLALDIDGDGAREVIAAGWDGRIYAFRPDGSTLEGFPLWAGGALFGTPAVAPLPSGGGLLVSAAWDGSVRGWRLPHARFAEGDWLQFRGGPARTGRVTTPFSARAGEPAPSDPPVPPARIEGAQAVAWREGRGLRRIEVQGTDLAYARRCIVEYTVSGKRSTHPVPVVNASGRSVAIVQALRRPHRIRYHVSYVDEGGTNRRWPESKDASFISVPLWAHRRPRETPPAREPSSGDRRTPSTDPEESPG